MLELPNFGHMTVSTIKFESDDKRLLVTFLDIIKIVAMFIKITFRDS